MERMYRIQVQQILHIPGEQGAKVFVDFQSYASTNNVTVSYGYEFPDPIAAETAVGLYRDRGDLKNVLCQIVEVL